MTTAELADELSVDVKSVRRALTSLECEDLAYRTTWTSEHGRPARWYAGPRPTDGRVAVTIHERFEPSNH
jgi:predicted ArsR family transcriptional regulator